MCDSENLWLIGRSIEKFSTSTLPSNGEVLKRYFLPSGPRVPLSLPAPDRECCIFGLTRQKNGILTMGANKEYLRSYVCHPSRRRG